MCIRDRDKEGKLVGLITYKDITKAKDKPMACKDAKGLSLIHILIIARGYRWPWQGRGMGT